MLRSSVAAFVRVVCWPFLALLSRRLGAGAMLGSPRRSAEVRLGSPQPRRTADPHLGVTEIAEAVDQWFDARGSRDLHGLMRRMRMEASWKTAPSVKQAKNKKKK